LLLKDHGNEVYFTRTLNPVLEMLDAIFSGISIGSVLLIAALGLAIVFGLMGVINMAHGELMMLGAYTTFLVQNLFKSFGEGAFEIYIFPALIAAFIVTAIAGVILERGWCDFSTVALWKPCWPPGE